MTRQHFKNIYNLKPKTHLPISVKRYVYHFYNNNYYFLYKISNSFSATKQNQKDNIT